MVKTRVLTPLRWDGRLECNNNNNKIFCPNGGIELKLPVHTDVVFFPFRQNSIRIRWWQQKKNGSAIGAKDLSYFVPKIEFDVIAKIQKRTVPFHSIPFTFTFNRLQHIQQMERTKTNATCIQFNYRVGMDAFYLCYTMHSLTIRHWLQHSTYLCDRRFCHCVFLSLALSLCVCFDVCHKLKIFCFLVPLKISIWQI